MYLENLKLTQFRNYENLVIDFTSGINCLVGDNGSGKTNLLDAIHYLSFTKSAFNTSDQQNIQHNADFFTIIGNFCQNDKKAIVRCSLKRGDKKKVFLGKNQVDKASDHVGNFPVVLIAPSDTGLILEGSDVRRKFFDSMIAQFNREYLDHLISYSYALKQRNELIRQFSERNKIDHDLLEPYDIILINESKYLSKVRSEFCTEFTPGLTEHYEILTENRETINLTYQSSALNEDFDLQFRNSLKKDLALQRTTVGIHRDDFLFEIDNYPLKKFGSQGQQKSFLIAIKLSQFDTLKKKKGFKPVLLLDDIFDKLDDHRIGKLVNMINDHQFGQVFITDARPERTLHFTRDLKSEVRILYIDQGEIKDHVYEK